MKSRWFAWLAVIIFSCIGSYFVIAPIVAKAAGTCYASDFFCPTGPDSEPLRYDGNVTITGQNISGSGSSHQDALPVRRSDSSGDANTVSVGDTIRLTMQYKPDHNGSSVVAWINGEVANANTWPTDGGADNYPTDTPTNCGQNGKFSNSSGTPYSSAPSHDTCPSDGYSNSDPVEKDNNCPSFYVQPPTNYLNGLGGLPAPGQYTWSVTSPGTQPPANAYVSTCAYSGVSKVWHSAGSTAGNTYTYSTDFKVNPDTKNKGRMCFMAQVSDGSAVNGQSANNSAPAFTHLKTRSGNKVCIKVGGVTISGNVHRSYTSSTGRGIEGLKVSCPRCDESSVNTDSNGHYTFHTVAGRNVTISVDSTILMPNPPSPADTPDNHTLLFYRTGDTDRSKTCENDCSISNDFTYDPNPNHPNVTVTPDTTAPLKPGDTIHYTLTTSNPYDANQNGVSIENFFPLNLDPSTVVIDGQANLTRDTGNGDPGGGWVIGPDTGSSGSVNNVNGPCAGTFNYFGYGMLFAPQNPAPSWFRCGYTAASGSSQPRSIYIYLGTMPAYSKITLSFYGKVKAADKVGVYPGYVAGVNSGDTRYCAGSDDYGSTGILTGCEDFSGGYQGVANFAGASTTQSTSNQWPAPALAPRRFGNTSNINYNPIPGAITCVSKATNGPFEDTDFSSTMSPCDGGAAQKDHYGYAANSNYNHATMTMQAARDTSLGPVDYVLLDQTDSIGIDQAIDPVSSNWHDYTYNPANRNISWGNFGNAATQSHMAGTGGSDINAISLDVQFNSSKSNPTGQTSSNYAQFCIIKYWEPGHGRQCSQTNTLTFRSFQKDSPYLDTASGNVHAGGTGGSLCSNSGTNTNSGTPVIGGGTSIGDYFVTSSGYVGTGSRNLATPGSVGVIYRPDLCAEAQRLGASGPAVSVLGASGSIDGGVNEGQVVTSNANYTLGSGGDVQINKRWTLFINGNLYIKSNVRYGPAQHATTNGVSKETNHPSFGVIVNGNIYIDRNVQNLDGFFVASKVLNTCTSDINGSTVSYQRADGSTAPGTLPVDQCNNKLFVNGSLFANTFRFNRIVPSASGQSEKVTFNNLLFTATPPGFNSLVNSYLISKYLIEPLPRY